jgi:hypothetical protein
MKSDLSIKKPKPNSIIIFALAMVLAIAGYFLFAQFADYTYESERHMLDLFRAKLWSIFLVMFFAAILYWKRHSEIAPPLAVLAVSIYFVIIYSILFRGTQYGLNGHWGDNGYRLLITCKMMAYNYFADSTIKDLTCLYPPLYYYLMAIYAKILGLEAFQTLKFGYLFVFLLYPWFLYFSWRPLVSGKAAAMISVATIFFAHRYINYSAYEHMTAALFIPWWLYFFEDARDRFIGKKLQWKLYTCGVLIGGAIFMTYYYWFFIAIAAFPLTTAARYITERSWRALLQNILHKAILAVGVALISAVYWLPILSKTGFTSVQTSFFYFEHSNLGGVCNKPLEGTMVLTGIFFAVYFWDRWKHARLAFYYGGALILIMLDRAFNLGNHSIQTRKILEFTHVLTIPPLMMGLETIWENVRKNVNIQRGLIALVVILAIIFGNDHIEKTRSGLYKTGINTRYPEAPLSDFENANCFGTVFLSHRYIDGCYLPYFAFTPISNVMAHPGGRFNERKNFLRAISKLKQPELVAYAMTYNIYDKIDYVFLPYIGRSGCFELQMNTVSFNTPLVTDTIRFYAEAFSDSAYFSKIHSNGMLEIKAPERSQERDANLLKEYPEIYHQLRQPDHTEVYK